MDTKDRLYEVMGHVNPDFRVNEKGMVNELDWKGAATGLGMAAGLATGAYGNPDSNDNYTRTSTLKGDYGTLHKTFRTTSVNNAADVERLINQGWTLDSTKVDTSLSQVLMVDGKIKVECDSLFIPTNGKATPGFQDGGFRITDEYKNVLKGIIGKTKSLKGTMFKIEIESSTDKQGLSQNLQADLSSLGFSPDNAGLSAARSAQIKTLLNEVGINDSIIVINQLKEMGNDNIDLSKRYVKVNFYTATRSQESTYVMNPQPNNKYYLSYFTMVYSLDSQKPTTGTTPNQVRPNTRNKPIPTNKFRTISCKDGSWSGLFKFSAK